MGQVILRRPKPEDHDVVLSFYHAFRERRETCIGMAWTDDFDAWLAQMDARESGIGLPAGFVPEHFRLCFDGEALVGVASLKLELTPYLLAYGGHVGYATHPDRRRRGYAKAMLGLLLDDARVQGMGRVLAVCDENNIASHRTILACGGAYEDTRLDPEEHTAVKRFWITTG